MKTMRAWPTLSAVTACLVGCVSSPRVPPDAGPLARPDAARSGDIVTSSTADWPDTIPLRGGPMAPVAPSMLGIRSAVAGPGRVVIADPDGDLLWLVDLPSQRALAIVLPAGAMPERMIEDRDGRVHVVLRGVGAVATLAPSDTSATIRPVCAAPRGIALRTTSDDPRADTLLVACAEGVLATMPVMGAGATSVPVDDDLRDVVVLGDHVFVSRFRSGEVLEVDAATGAILQRAQPEPLSGPDPLAPSGSGEPTIVVSVPRVAWRLQQQDDGLLLVHQVQRTAPIPSRDVGAAYGDASESTAIVQSARSTVAVHADGSLGTWSTERAPFRGPATDVYGDRWIRADGHVQAELLDMPADALGNVAPFGPLWLERAPLVLHYGDEPHRRWMALDPTRRRDRGRDLFHQTSPSGVACASCHPEGGDDGHVWQNLPGIAVRTQTTRGDVLATPPYHREGDIADFDALLHATWIGRMGGDALSTPDVDALTSWIGTLAIPARPAVDGDAAAAGRAIFERSDVACGRCHAGERFSSGASADVGTGGSFQIPELRGVVYRAPFMHSGCAATLADVFTSGASCSGTLHAPAVTVAERRELVAYLETL